MKKETNKSSLGQKLLKILKILFIIFVAIIAVGFLLYYWPHEKVQITLPFVAEDDSGTGLIPMGEIEQWHNASTGLPNGHPGLDFQWNKETKITAVGDGRIIAIYKNHEDKYIVEQSLGLHYMTIYQELNKVEPNLRFFSKVEKGQLIGYTGYHRTDFTGAPKPSDPSGQIHWDLSKIGNSRLCPLAYFDSQSRERIEVIWARVKAKGEYRQAFPNICNGIYKNQKEY